MAYLPNPNQDKRSDEFKLQKTPAFVPRRELTKKMIRETIAATNQIEIGSEPASNGELRLTVDTAEDPLDSRRVRKEAYQCWLKRMELRNRIKAAADARAKQDEFMATLYRRFGYREVTLLELCQDEARAINNGTNGTNKNWWTGLRVRWIEDNKAGRDRTATIETRGDHALVDDIMFWVRFDNQVNCGWIPSKELIVIGRKYD